MPSKQFVWLDGKFIKKEEAVMSILAHPAQYGSGIFEGIRAYKTNQGTAVFRLEEHVDRHFSSANIYSMDLRLSREQVALAVLDTIRKNKMEEGYIRPFSFFDVAHIGINPGNANVVTAVMTENMGNYFGKTEGIRCMVSSWQKFSSAALPARAKCSGNYANSKLATVEAKRNGFDEAILLTHRGTVAEGPGQNIFLVQNNRLVTPSVDSDILVGITRDTVMKIAKRHGIETHERSVSREELYMSDEVFFTGTASEVKPIIEIDSKRIANGQTGSITKLLALEYDRIVRGQDPEFSSWLTYVKEKERKSMLHRIEAFIDAIQLPDVPTA